MQFSVLDTLKDSFSIGLLDEKIPIEFILICFQSLVFKESQHVKIC